MKRMVVDVHKMKRPASAYPPGTMFRVDDKVNAEDARRPTNANPKKR
jgi:hypothetical protein